MNLPPTLKRRRWTFFLVLVALALVALGRTVQFQWHHRADAIERKFDAATLHVNVQQYRVQPIHRSCGYVQC